VSVFVCVVVCVVVCVFVCVRRYTTSRNVYSTTGPLLSFHLSSTAARHALYLYPTSPWLHGLSECVAQCGRLLSPESWLTDRRPSHQNHRGAAERCRWAQAIATLRWAQAIATLCTDYDEWRLYAIAIMTYLLRFA